MNVILASASPRRRELMSLVVPRFETAPADIDETLPPNIPPEKAAEYLAEKKAAHTAALYPDSIVIGCDTVVLLDGIVMGKPHNTDDAERMLRLLSGRTHLVITGVCIALGEKTKSFSERTEVSFYPLSDEEIHGYAATGEPTDKAGAYGIQGLGCVLVSGIKGDFFNVVGLPAARLRRELAEFGADRIF